MITVRAWQGESFVRQGSVGKRKMPMQERMTSVRFHVTIHEEDDGSFWSEVDELPGCFASGFSLEELQEATFDAIQLWLPDGIELGEPRWGPPKAQKSAKSAKQPKKALVCA